MGKINCINNRIESLKIELLQSMFKNLIRLKFSLAKSEKKKFQNRIKILEKALFFYKNQEVKNEIVS